MDRRYKRSYDVAFRGGSNNHGQFVVGGHRPAVKVQLDRERRPRKKYRKAIAPEVLALLGVQPTFPVDEPFVYKFGDSLPRESNQVEYKATKHQDRGHAWRILKEELPRNLVTFLNSSSGTFSLFLGFADSGYVFGVWLNADQRHRLPEEISGLIRTKINRLVIQQDDYTLSFLHVDPGTLKPVEDHRLYVIKVDVRSKNPTEEGHLYATRKSPDSDPKYQKVYLRVGCAQVAHLTKKEIGDLVRDRQDKVSMPSGASTDVAPVPPTTS